MRLPRDEMLPLIRHGLAVLSCWPLGRLDVGGCSNEATPATPIPGGHEPAPPHAQASLAGLALLVHVVIGEPPVRERPALGHHGGVDVLTFGVVAHGDDATVPVNIALLAVLS